MPYKTSLRELAQNVQKEMGQHATVLTHPEIKGV